MKKLFKVILIFQVLIMGVVFYLLTPSCWAAEKNEDTVKDVVTTEDSSKVSRPLIIWFHDIESGPKALSLAISSGFFSHVMLEGVHEFDIPNYYTIPKFREALKVLRKHKDIKVIWTRWLYPGRKLKGFTLEDMYDSQYYIARIRYIKKEAEQMGADFIALDAEPYIDCPVKIIKNSTLSEKEFQKLNIAVKTATEVTGQVDFILASATYHPRRFYNATQHFGKLIITEHTYFDIPERLNYARLNEDKVPYDIFGAHVRVTKVNERSAKELYFTPREILERQYLWSDKKGLFIFPGPAPKAPLAVAREFSKIRNIRPVNK